MRITAVETIRDPDHPFLLWVRIHTDEGIVGEGESPAQPTAIAEPVHAFAQVLVGEDPSRIELLWHKLFQMMNYTGVGGAEFRALSAIDIALWDLLGKALEQPVYALLGGACRDAVPVYNTCGNWGDTRDRDAFLSDAGALARELLDQGTTMMKIWPFDGAAKRHNGQRIEADDLEAGVSCFKSIRDAVGDRVEIALDGHSLWNLPSAIRIARAVEPYRPLWMEDMIWPDNPSALAELRRSTSVPVMASERLMGRWAFHHAIESGAADIVMPDLGWTGGLSEGKKIATLASLHQLPIAPHNCGGPIGHAAAVHFCATVYNLLAVETFRAFYRGFFADIVTQVFLPVNGAIPLPQGPGLGTELRPEFLARQDLIRRVTSDASPASLGLAAGDPWATMKF